MDQTPTIYTEGKATFDVGNAFYRQESRMARDLGVLVAAVYKRETGQLRILDGMTGCGIRPLRYLLEAGADFVQANDADPALGEILQANLAQLPTHTYGISHENTLRLLLRCYQEKNDYDLVDLDSFGNPAPYLNASLLATKPHGLIYLTSTDGRSVSGHAPVESLRLLATYARSHPAVQEQGLRILIGSLLQQAGMQGLSIQPVFSYFHPPVYRVMVRLVKQPWSADSYGFLGYCHQCGQFQTLTWRSLNQVHCTEHPQTQPLVISGPLWLGNLHDPHLLATLIDLAKTWDWLKQVRLLEMMQVEANFPPYYYPLGEIGRRGKMDIPNRDRLVQALQAQGHRACRTHIDAQAIKTDAPLKVCLKLARELNNQCFLESNPSKS